MAYKYYQTNYKIPEDLQSVLGAWDRRFPFYEKEFVETKIEILKDQLASMDDNQYDDT